MFVSLFSTGPIGLICLLVARVMGASQVIITGNMVSKHLSPLKLLHDSTHRLS